MRLMYFAILKEKLKKEEEEMDFKGSLAELREFLMKKHPDLRDLFRVIKFAVNEEYEDDSYELEGDERVALIPPVSGG
ncbi:MAG: MoaD/ThiS family protein [Aquificaceae bacterium]